MEPTSFEPFTRVKACRHGQMIYNIHDQYVGRSFDLYGEFSEGEVDVFRQLVQPGNVVLDIGANIGSHTIFFAKQVGPAGGVYAFEPQRIVFQMLCGNAALNNATNVWCHQVALGREPGKILVPQFDFHKVNNVGGLGLGAFQFGESIPVITIDSLELNRCDLMKIDVEGMEEETLRGATATIAKFKPVLYVENDREEKSASLIRFIDSLGYAMFWHHPPLFNPNNFAGEPHNVFSNIVSANMLCVHRSATTKIDGMAPVVVPRG